MKKSILCLTLVTLLASCGGTSSLSTNSNTTSIEAKPNVNYQKVNSVKEAMTSLAENTYIISVLGGNDGVKNYYFDPNFYYDSTDNEGYLIKNNTVYDFIIVNNEVKVGETYEQNLYGEDGLVTTFVNIDFTNIEDGKTISSSKRDFARPVLDLLGIGSGYYTELKEDIVISIDGENSDDLEFTVPLESSTYTGLVIAYDNSLDNVFDFINHGEITPIDENLLRIRDLFYNDNFTLMQYGEDPGVPISYSFFTDTYFMPVYTEAILSESPLLVGYQRGYMEILSPDKTLKIGQLPELIYDNIFLFGYYGSYESADADEVSITTMADPNNSTHALGAFDIRVDDITKAMNYPKYMTMFSSLQAFYQVESSSGVAYETADKSIVDDCLANYQLTGSFDSYGGISKIQIINIPADEENNERVVIRLLTPDGNYYDLDHTNFGTTEFAPFERFRELYQLD